MGDQRLTVDGIAICFDGSMETWQEVSTLDGYRSIPEWTVVIDLPTLVVFEWNDDPQPDYYRLLVGVPLHAGGSNR